MQHAERVKFAQNASERAGALLGATVVGSFYTEALQQKVIAALKAVDHAVIAAGMPLLVPGIVPGFDLLACKRPGLQLQLDDEPIDPRAALKLDSNTVELLRQVAELAMPGMDKGTFAYQANDGLYYFAFRSAYRADAMAAMGILPDEVRSVETAGSEVLQ